ncbi:hypothetical protein MVEG_05254 [Podila verticillata NRRL 6337]|nr:hypothetical protein MVEG_05254 [Podila verticillata NRRL 6337]
MSNTMILVGLKRFIERQIYKSKRSPFEYVVLATLGFLVAAVAKYPNRAFLTRARPDLEKCHAVGYPLLGNMPQLLRNRSDSLNSMNTAFKHFGDVFTLTIPLFGRIILVNSPEIVEHVLKTNFNNYIKGKIFYDQLRDILGHGIFVSDGDAWRFHRKTASNVFTTRLYRQLVEGAFRDSANDLIGVLEHSQKRSQGPVDLQALFLKLTLDAFGKLTFGLEFNAMQSEGSNDFGDAFDYLTADVDARSANPFWFITDKFEPGKSAALSKAIGTLHKWAKMAITARRNETPEAKEARQRDLLDHFYSYTSDDGSRLDDTTLEEIFINFMIAGRDTTAQQLTWQFYSLMSNPRIMKNLVKEVDLVLQGSDTYTYETIMNELPYMKAVFHETLRLYPPVPKNVKTAVEDDVLPGGVKVYKGDVIGISSYCLGRNKAVWGEDAELFVPERWLVDEENNEHQDNNKANKTTLLQRFKFALLPGQPTPLAKPSMTLPMNQPLYATVSDRV